MKCHNKIFFKPDDLGKPLPESEYAVSVCMPTWQHVVDYEEGKDYVHNALQSAYPRFVYSRQCRDLFRQIALKQADRDEGVIVFPCREAAQECIQFAGKGRTKNIDDGICAAIFPVNVQDKAREYWQHAGRIISGRQAESILNKTRPDNEKGKDAKKSIIKRISHNSGYEEYDVYLYPSGMAAIYDAYRFLRDDPRDKKHAVQFGFPYIDTLKIIKKFGNGEFINYETPEDIDRLGNYIGGNPVDGVFAEVPSNPMLRTIDFKRLGRMLRHYNVPLVMDDTVGTFFNLDMSEYADILVTSLTKFFSGVGDVTCGSLCLNRKSSFYESFKQRLDRYYEDIFFAEDAIALEQNSRDFDERMPVINRNAEILADYLKNHKKIAQVNYPKFVDKDLYNVLKTEKGGYGGLLSFTLKNMEDAVTVYDSLQINKGPSLGTNYSLACPYTLLAHYNELDFVESCGISRYLLRVSVGMEDHNDIVRRFEVALK